MFSIQSTVLFPLTFIAVRIVYARRHIFPQLDILNQILLPKAESTILHSETRDEECFKSFL